MELLQEGEGALPQAGPEQWQLGATPPCKKGRQMRMLGDRPMGCESVSKHVACRAPLALADAPRQNGENGRGDVTMAHGAPQQCPRQPVALFDAPEQDGENHAGDVTMAHAPQQCPRQPIDTGASQNWESEAGDVMMVIAGAEEPPLRQSHASTTPAFDVEHSGTDAVPVPDSDTESVIPEPTP